MAAIPIIDKFHLQSLAQLVGPGIQLNIGSLNQKGSRGLCCLPTSFTKPVKFLKFSLG